MKVSVQKTFEKDVGKITDKKLANLVLKAIEKMENCKELSELSQIKKMRSSGNYYRMRIGDYRLGFKIENGIIIILRFMHRKGIYNYFP
ncbi:MAG TPA: type II toxin-antitoxin system RelE/ParE family toxin [Ginsengibacter sp.]